jgi:hypothetical protein
VVIIGLSINLILLGVAGFVLIVGSCLAALSSLRGPTRNGPVAFGPRSDTRNNKPTGLRMKMEDRMRRRFDEN